jgi:hypothetical protein
MVDSSSLVNQYRFLRQMATTIDPSIKVKINKQGVIIMSNISEADLGLLTFQTTTPQETVSSVLLIGAIVYLLNVDPKKPTEVPGFSQQMSFVFSTTNSAAFLASQPTFKPFAVTFNTPVNPPTRAPISVNTYLDYLTTALPNVAHTYGQVKTYTLALTLANYKGNTTWEIGTPSSS